VGDMDDTGQVVVKEGYRERTCGTVERAKAKIMVKSPGVLHGLTELG